MAARTAAQVAPHKMREPRYDDFGPTPLIHRPQPGSPTLTNPDMILPDYDEPEPFGDQLQSPLIMWNHTQPSDPFLDFSQSGYVAGPLHPITPIIYGNGTMLSDIGEVTEAESNVGHQPVRHSSRAEKQGAGFGDEDGAPLRSSPTMGRKTLKKRSHLAKRERRLSIESTSTIHTTDGTDEDYGGFNDCTSLDDANFQGDDEESLASGFTDEKLGPNPTAAIGSTRQGIRVDRFSSNSLSERAEQILASAKRRLTTMEDNLNRARTFSYSSASDGSTPSPGIRQFGTVHDMTPSATPGHSRNVSEDDLQANKRVTALPQRSASALGAAGGYRQHLPLSRSADALGAKNSYLSMRSPLLSIDSTLEPVNEDEDPHEYSHSRSSSRYQSITSPALSQFSDTGATRSASAAQVRDLHDQMQGLKGKISSLKEQAKQDSLKRRSLQSLRALSPFTNAGYDPHYSDSVVISTPESSSPSLESAANESTPRSLQKDETRTSGYGELRSASEEGQHRECGQINEAPDQGISPDHLQAHHGESAPAHDDTLEPDPRPVHETGHLPHNNEGLERSGEEEAVGFDDVSESGESLYHDTQQELGNISHEDREDAFDYENFFLHSAMGTLNRRRTKRSDSIGSEESDDSVETTRGPAMTSARRSSIDTTASVDTFATAREGTESPSSVTGPKRREQGVVAPMPLRADSISTTAPKSTTNDGFDHCSGHIGEGGVGSGSGSGSESTGQTRKHARFNSVVHRPPGIGTELPLHRPSVSSFESTGTNRSFPLVKKVGANGRVLRGPSESPEKQLKQVSESLMNETASICDRDSLGSGPQSPAIQTLSREDQVLVEQVVASLGKCVLGLSEATRHGSDDVNHYRQRIAAAKRFLENDPDCTSESS